MNPPCQSSIEDIYRKEMKPPGQSSIEALDTITLYIYIGRR